MQKSELPEKFSVTCKRCENEWVLYPNKWKNLSFIKRKGKHVKVVYCPACMCPNYLTSNAVLKILERFNHAKHDNRYSTR